MVPILTGLVNVLHRAAKLVIAQLHRSHSLIGHVAIGTAHPGSSMSSLSPQFEFWVLHLKQRCAGFSMFVIEEFRAIRKFSLLPMPFQIFGF